MARKFSKIYQAYVKWLHAHHCLAWLALFAVASSALLFLYIEYRYFGGDLSKLHTYLFHSWRADLYSIGILLLLSIALAGAIGDIIIAESVLAALVVIFSFISSAKFAARNEPLLPQDFVMTSEAGSLSSMVNIRELVVTVIAAGVLVVGGILASRWFWRRQRLPIRAKRPWWSTAWRRTLLTAAGCALVYAAAMPFMGIGENTHDIDFLGIQLVNWNQTQNFDDNGVIIGFIYNIRGAEMSQPNDYSQTVIKMIVDKYKAIATERNIGKTSLANQKINLIYIMNESFSDPTALSGSYPFNGGDPIPATRQLMANYPSGYNFSPGYGGGTADIEFEALTGLSTYYLNMMPYPSKLANTSNFPSTASLLATQGYTTSALHPFDGLMYKREFVYKNIGFQSFTDQTGFANKASVASSPTYISDASAYQQLMAVVSRSSAPQFALLVTMQNHMPYDHPPSSPQFASTTASTNINEQNSYLASLNASDTALKQLTDELAKSGQKTVVVFWGDHRPGIYPNLPSDPVDSQLRYETPLLVYANFPLAHTDLGAISPNYITPTVLGLLNAPKTPLQYLLNDLKAINPRLTKANQENIKDTDLLRDYQLIEYDILSGKRYSQALGMFSY